MTGTAGRGTVRDRARRFGTAMVAASLLGIVGIVVPDAAPAGAAPDGRSGLTQQTAGASCWSIKQSYPTSPDGIYWLWTPKLVAPQQF